MNLARARGGATTPFPCHCEPPAKQSRAGGDSGAEEALQAVGRDIANHQQTDAPRSGLLHLDRVAEEDFALVPAASVAGRVVPVAAWTARLVHSIGQERSGEIWRSTM